MISDPKQLPFLVGPRDNFFGSIPVFHPRTCKEKGELLNIIFQNSQKISKIDFFFNYEIVYIFFLPNMNVGVFLACLCLTCVQHKKVSY